MSSINFYPRARCGRLWGGGCAPAISQPRVTGPERKQEKTEAVKGGGGRAGGERRFIILVQLPLRFSRCPARIVKEANVEEILRPRFRGWRVGVDGLTYTDTGDNLVEVRRAIHGGHEIRRI